MSDTTDMLATDDRTLRKVYRKFDPDYLVDAAAALAFWWFK